MNSVNLCGLGFPAGLARLTRYNKFGIIGSVKNDAETCDKPLVILHGAIKTPPLSAAARIEAGVALRRLQRGEGLSMPLSRPMPSIGRRCAELRIVDENVTWRIIYRADPDAVLIADVFAKKTQATPKSVIALCRKRLAVYDEAMKEV